MDDTLTDPLAGRLLDGRYAVTARIAHGGMATVYLATDTRLDRQVALKVMHAELARDDDFVRRFIGEAKSVARLSHQNVVAVYDQGADGPFLYLAMEYVPGRTLRDLLREQGRFSPALALDILACVLDGLAAAHASGIVHRDVKPENVLLTGDGRLKVADFGLARAQAAAAHTRSGLIIGTVAYLSPELVTGGSPIGPRSDVYSAGVLLFELLTGRQPFTGETPISVAYQHANSDVPAPSALLPELPAAVDRLVLDATERDPAARPADAAIFLRAVRQVRAQLGPPAQAGYGLAGLVGPARMPGVGVGVQGLAEAPWLDASGYGFAMDSGRSHTMVVHRDEAAEYLGRESFLGRWLFSRRLIVVALVFAVGIALGVGGWWYASGRYTPVPSVAGDTTTAAAYALTHNGFQVTTGPQENSNTVPKGMVAGTSPSGRALKGTTITLLVSAGPFTSVVPTVRGDTLSAAKAALARVHLSDVVEQVGSTLPIGTVTGTTPKADTSWSQTQTVTILVAAGKPMPDFIGMQKSSAGSLAASDGLTVSYASDTSSNQPAGVVVAQSPAKNSLVKSGGTLTLTVSAGPQNVLIPYVIGFTVSSARSTLEAAGFKVVVQSGGYFIGRVFDETPSPFGTAPFGSTITLDVTPFANGNGNGGNGNGGGGI